MDLDQLKKEWQEISEKIDNTNILYKEMTINNLKRGVRNTGGKIERYEYLFLALSAVMTALASMLLAFNSERVFKNESIMVLIGVFVTAGLWQGYKIYLLGKIDYENSSVIELLKNFSRFRLLTQARFIGGVALIIPVIILLIHFSRDTLTGEMIGGMIAGGFIGLIIGLRTFFSHWKNIDELLNDLKEIEDLTKKDLHLQANGKTGHLKS